MDRRTFVRKSSALILVGSVGCGAESTTTTDGPKGTLHVSVSGITGTPPNGGSAVAQRTDAPGDPILVTISAVGTGSATNVPHGNYTVALTPPAGFNVSGANPVTGVVVGEATGQVAFTVAPMAAATGTVRVLVNGLTGAATGGAASARLTNNTGSTFAANLSIPAGGVSGVDLTGLPPGTYNVTYTPPGGYRRVNGETNPVLATVTSGATSTASFAAEAIPVSGGGVIFVSNWSTAALGTANPSRGDAGKWNLIGGFGQEVVSSAGLDFPSPKVCKFVANRQNSGFALLRHTGMPVPAVGTTRYYRWYTRMTFPDPIVGNGDHPWQDGNAVGDCNWMVVVHYGTEVSPARNGQWRLGVIFLLNTNGQFAFGPWLDKHKTYRIECALTRLTSTTYDFQMRVYDTANALVFSDADFPADAGGGTLATRGPWTFRNVANLDGFNCGTNDFETAGNDWWTTTFDYSYQGCFAIRDDQGWLGPYGSVTGEPLV
jgi:hypothetical protein